MHSLSKVALFYFVFYFYLSACYFNDNLLDMILKQFSSKYAINESQKRIIHLECFSDHFIDSFVEEFVRLVDADRPLDFNYEYKSNASIFTYMAQLFDLIDLECASNRLALENQAKNINTLMANAEQLVPLPSVKSSLEFTVSENKSFWHKTCMLPIKLAFFLSNYRRFHSVTLRNSKENDTGNYLEKCEEMREIIGLFKSSCEFFHKNLEVKKLVLNEKDIVEIFDVTALKEQFLIYDVGFFFNLKFDSASQLEVLQRCIEMSITNHLSSVFATSKEGDFNQMKESQSNSSGIVRQKNGLILVDSSTTSHSVSVNRLLHVLSSYLPIEIEINSKLYSELFLSSYASFESQQSFEMVCTRLVVKHFLHLTFEIIKNDQCSVLTLKSNDVKLHLNLYLNMRHFLAGLSLSECPLEDLASFTFLGNGYELNKYRYLSLSEFFQPFLIEYIRIQEDQFIKYIHKIYDADKLTDIAAEMANLLNRRMSTIPSIQSIKSINF